MKPLDQNALFKNSLQQNLLLFKPKQETAKFSKKETEKPKDNHDDERFTRISSSDSISILRRTISQLYNKIGEIQGGNDSLEIKQLKAKRIQMIVEDVEKLIAEKQREEFERQHKTHDPKKESSIVISNSLLKKDNDDIDVAVDFDFLNLNSVRVTGNIPDLKVTPTEKIDIDL